MTAGQLELIEGHDDWQLDETDRAAGRRGVEQARAALRSARQRLAERDEPHDQPTAA